MPFEALANLTFVAHGIFVILVIPSTYLLVMGFYRSRPTLALMHYLSMVIMTAGQLRFGECPLVTLERALRQRAGTEMWYDSGYVNFMTQHLTGILLPSGSVGMITMALVLASLAALLRQLTAGDSERAVTA